MRDSDKQPLPWWPEGIVSNSAEKDVKGKGKVGSDVLCDLTHGFNLNNEPTHGFNLNTDEVCIPIRSASSASSSFSEEETVSRDELAIILTPEPLPGHDDRVRRSSLWVSAVAINTASRTFSDDSEARRNEIREETKAGKRVAEIDEPLSLLSQSASSSDVESQGLLQHDPVHETKEVDVLVHSLETANHANRLRSEMKTWVQKSDEKRNSIAERLSDLLKPRPVSAAVADPEVPPRERKRVSTVSKEKQISQLNKTPSLKKDPLAERMPPEWVLLLLGCVLGLSTGLSVVSFNKLVCLLQVHTLLVSRPFMKWFSF